jgi:hypothetical protein
MKSLATMCWATFPRCYEVALSGMVWRSGGGDGDQAGLGLVGDLLELVRVHGVDRNFLRQQRLYVLVWDAQRSV